MNNKDVNTGHKHTNTKGNKIYIHGIFDDSENNVDQVEMIHRPQG